jgi:multiple sugar transport system permease protein
MQKASWFRPVYVISSIWKDAGWGTVVYLAAISGIDPSLYESAAIDGASKAQQLFHVTLPLLKPTTWLVILLQVIACFKVFGQIYLITGGGPASSTRPLIQYIYETAFNKSNMGYAAAMSYVLFFILVVLSLLQQYIQRKGEREE